MPAKLGVIASSLRDMALAARQAGNEVTLMPANECEFWIMARNGGLRAGNNSFGYKQTRTH